MNYGKLTAGTTKTAIDTAKPSEMGEIITYLSRMGDVLEPVPQRGKLVIFPCCVYTVVNGNVAHFIFGKDNLYQLPGFQIITSQTGKVFCYDGRHVPGFNLMQHGLKPLTLKAHAGKSVVYKKACVEKVVFVSILL